MGRIKKILKLIKQTHYPYYNTHGQRALAEMDNGVECEVGLYYPEYCGDEVNECEMYNFNKLMYVSEKCVQVFSATTLELIGCIPRS